MTLLSVLRAQVASALQTAEGIGQVHDYFRRAQHDAEAKALFEASGKLHVWFLTLADDTPYSERRKPAGCSEATVRFAVHGYFALKDADASEKGFETVLQAVLEVLRRPSMSLTPPVIEAAPPTVSVHGHVTFAEVLCHYARIEMSIRAHLEG